MKKQSKTNWNRIDTLKDQDIDYSDAPKLTSSFFEKAARWPANKELISLRLDPDVLTFFRTHGKGYQTAINNLLRKYMEVQTGKSSVGVSPSDEDLLLPFEIKCLSLEYKSFLKIKRNKRYATVQMFSTLLICCLLVDQINLEEFSDLDNLREPTQMVPMMLSIQAHSQYRFSFELAFSGALPEAMSLLRNGIECVAVAYKLHGEPNLTSIWVDKYDVEKEEDEYSRYFEFKRKESLFSSRPELIQLYEYWRTFSEEGPHSNVRTLGRRTTFDEAPTHFSWLVNYLETKPRILGSSLLALLHVSHLIEKVVFNIFEQKLEFEEDLLRKRELFSKYHQQVKQELQRKLESASNP